MGTLQIHNGTIFFHGSTAFIFKDILQAHDLNIPQTIGLGGIYSHLRTTT